MFDSESRYHELEDRRYRGPDGRQVVYVSRRFLPPLDAEGDVTLTEVEVAPTDRPDLVAARALGDPELFWRLADSNDVMDPFELTAASGRRLRVLLT